MIRLAAVAVIVALGAGPAFAYPNCTIGGMPGLRVEIGISTDDFSEQDQIDFDLLQAQRHGINADTAERTWLDCVKITRLDASGAWVTEYYDPRSWDLVPID